MAGGLLLSGVDAAAEEEGEATSNALWACGAILMALGTIYVGKLAHDGVKCCLRRLRATELGDDVGNSWILCDASESEEEGSSSMPSRSGSHSKRGATSKSLTSHSGLRGERSTSSSGPMPLNMTLSSGLQHGEHSPSGACVASKTYAFTVGLAKSVVQQRSLQQLGPCRDRTPRSLAWQVRDPNLQCFLVVRTTVSQFQR